MIRIKRDRTRRAGYKTSMNAQDFGGQAKPARRLIAGNAKTCYTILRSNLLRQGSELSEKEQQALSLIVYNLKRFVDSLA